MMKKSEKKNVCGENHIHTYQMHAHVENGKTLSSILKTVALNSVKYCADSGPLNK